MKAHFQFSSVLIFLLGLGLPLFGVSQSQGTSWQPAFYPCGPTHDPAHCASLLEGGFEGYTDPNVAHSGIWRGYGADAKGIDINYGQARSGRNNGWLRNSTRNWNSLYQFLSIQPGHPYALHVFLRATPNVHDGYFTVRAGRDVNGRIITEQRIAGDGTYREYILRFDSGDLKDITIYAGFWGVGADAWMQMDDFYLEFFY
jgi:hypothetical protein